MPRIEKPISDTLLTQLIARGDRIEVIRGQMVIIPQSNKPVPGKWLKENRETLMCEIARNLQIPVYQYTGFTTGRFNNGRFPGVKLNFIEVSTGASASAFFNAHLDKLRGSTQRPDNGRLQDKYFRVGEHSKLFKFWKLAGLPKPRRLAELYKSMGKLKAVYFTGKASQSAKLLNESLIPLTINASQVLSGISDNSSTVCRQSFDNLSTRVIDNQCRQDSATTNVDKEIASGQVFTGLSTDRNYVSKSLRVNETTGDLTTCANDYVLSNQVEKNKVTPLPSNKKHPKDQTNEEWLADYDSAG